MTPDAFTQRVAARLTSNLAGARVSITNPLTLSFRLGEGPELVVSLDRIHDGCRRVPDSCDGELSRLEDALRASQKEEAVTRSQLYVVLRSGAYLAQVKKIDPSVRTRPLAGELFAVAMFDLGSRARNARDTDFATLKIDPEAAFELGRDNVIRRRGSVRLVIEGSGVKAGAVGGDFYISSLLLDSAGWNDLARKHPGRIIAGVPAFDSLVWALDASDSDVAALRLRVDDLAARASHPLSTELFSWHNGKWEVLPR